jgi:hypothetical protein
MDRLDELNTNLVTARLAAQVVRLVKRHLKEDPLLLINHGQLHSHMSVAGHALTV